MAIIGTLPNNIQNGQLADAVPVMADFNFIVNQVNANATPLGTLTAPTGTTMSFNQATAPLGWVATNAAAYQDAFIRSVVPASFIGLGGSAGASTVITSGATTGNHTLTQLELPAHNHAVIDSGHTHTLNDPTHSHTAGVFGGFLTTAGGAGTLSPGGSSSSTAATAPAATGITMNAALTGITTDLTGANNGHTHPWAPSCKFVDFIVAVKS